MRGGAPSPDRPGSVELQAREEDRGMYDGHACALARACKPCVDPRLCCPPDIERVLDAKKTNERASRRTHQAEAGLPLSEGELICMPSRLIVRSPSVKIPAFVLRVPRTNRVSVGSRVPCSQISSLAERYIRYALTLSHPYNVYDVLRSLGTAKGSGRLLPCIPGGQCYFNSSASVDDCNCEAIVPSSAAPTQARAFLVRQRNRLIVTQVNIYVARKVIGTSQVGEAVSVGPPLVTGILGLGPHAVPHNSSKKKLFLRRGSSKSGIRM